MLVCGSCIKRGYEVLLNKRNKAPDEKNAMQAFKQFLIRRKIILET